MAWFLDIVKVLCKGHRVIFFRRFLPGTFGLSLGQSIFLVAVALVLSAAIGYGLNPKIYGINGSGLNASIAGWTVFALLLIAFKAKSHFVNVREVFVAAVVMDIWLGAIFGALFSVASPNWTSLSPGSAYTWFWALTGLWVGSILWQYAATFWAGRTLSQFGLRSFGWRAVLSAALVLVLVPQDRLFTSNDRDPLRQLNIWPWIENWSYRAFASARNSADDETSEKKKRIDFESLLDQQAERVSNALNGIKSSDPGKPNLYFVGMASYADQDVFMREIQATRDVFDDRFRTDGRSIVLNNNEATAETLPIASLANLRRVLHGLAGKMDVDKDILVLFLTSHGSEGSISVDFSGAPLNDLKAGELAATLDASGIKNRVVIISACHSGSFIPSLQNDNSAILTAAHASKVSFGCSNEREWTYFSDALVNHALRTTYSFKDAFEKAKSLIGEWETKDKLTPSEPQIFVGAAISAKLEELARDLESSNKKAELK